MSYLEKQQLRETLRSFPADAAFAISVLVEQVVLGWEAEVETQLDEIATKFSIPAAEVKIYFDWLSAETPNAVTLHYTEKTPEENDCFVITLDGTQGPNGSVVVLSLTKYGAVYYPQFVYLAHFDAMKESMLEALLLIKNLDTTVEDIFSKGCVLF